GLHVIKTCNKRGNEPVVVGLLDILGYDDELLGEKRKQLLAVDMLFKTVQLAVQHHPCRIFAYQISILVKQIQLFPVVVYGWIVVCMLRCSYDMKLDGGALLEDFEPTPCGFAIVAHFEHLLAA